MTTRRATLDDLGAIMALERASFPTDAWSDAMMREEILSPHGWYVVVEEAGHLVGYAGLRAVHGSRDADVQTIALAAPARGRGRGRALLRTLLTEAARRRVREVFLEVRADNPVAQALYASEGFQELGRRPKYYQPDGVDAIVMRLEVTGWLAARGPDAAAAASAPATVPAPTGPRTSEDRVNVGGSSSDAPTEDGFSDAVGVRERAAANEAGACT